MLNKFIKIIYKNPPPLSLPSKELAVWIYQNHFCRGKTKNEITCTKADITNYRSKIALACSSLKKWVSIANFEMNGSVLTTSINGLRISAKENEWQKSGDKMEVWFPFYTLGEDGWLWIEPGMPNTPTYTTLSRFYITIKPEAIIDFIQEATHLMLNPPIPFHIKFARHLLFFEHRRDGCVLYFNRKNEENILKEWQPVFENIARLDGFSDDVIPLTMTVRPGVFYAEDPASEESFGMNRSRIIATAIQKCKKKASLEEWWKALQLEWKKEGLSIEQPWLAKARQGSVKI